MNETAHTPGPWEAVAHKLFIEARTGYIAEMFGMPTYEETSANAQLIAAAPDLLEACELAYGEYWNHMSNCADLSDGTMAKLEVAIAKAKG